MVFKNFQSASVSKHLLVVGGGTLNGGDAENARHENARNAIVWNTIAEQECMSRQEGAPDFAANCVLVNAGYVRSVSHRAT